MGLTYDALFPGRFIKAGEMDGKPATMTIKEVYLDHIEGEDGREKPQAVVAFQETPREMALNKTNGQCLKALFGPQVDDWIGKRVTLYPERDTSGLSDSGVCLRVLGSPEIDRELTVEIKLPRRKPQKRKLKPTGKAKTSTETHTEAPQSAVAGAEGVGQPEAVAEPETADSDDGDVPGHDAASYRAAIAAEAEGTPTEQIEF